MITTISKIKSWFRSGSKPTQSQFWATWDSFWHKNEKISISNIEGIDQSLDDKLDKKIYNSEQQQIIERLETKVDKEFEKGLSSNDFSNELKDKLVALENYVHPESHKISEIEGLNDILTNNSTAIQELNTAEYLKSDSVVELAKEGLSIRDQNGVPQFSVTQFLEIDKSLLDTDNKRIVSNYPKPYINNLVTTSLIPNTTGDIEIEGDFFTPNTTAIVEGCTINYVRFFNSQKIFINVTTGTEEMSSDISLDNGSKAIYEDAFLISLGTVFIPRQIDWNDNNNANVYDNGSVKVLQFGSQTSALWNQEFDYQRDWILRFRPAISPLGTYPSGSDYRRPRVQLVKASDNTSVLQHQIYDNKAGSVNFRSQTRSENDEWANTGISVGGFDTISDLFFEIRYLDGVLYAFQYGQTVRTFTDVLDENLKLLITVRHYNIEDIKYIEL